MAITRHGRTIGYYIPSLEKDPATDVMALKAAASKLDALLKSVQLDAGEVVAEFAARRRKK